MLRRHATTDRHAGVLPTSLLLLLEVVLVVGHLLLLFVRHVAGMHSGRTRDVGLLGRGSIDVGVVDVLGGLRWDLGGIDAILASGRVGGVEASLDNEYMSGHSELIRKSKVLT